MKKMKNEVSIMGLLYDHDLQKKTTGKDSKTPGVEYITGTISVATDDACLNIIPIHYTYVTAITKSGKPNSTFTALDNILSGAYPTMMGVSKERATHLRINTSIALNEFYSNRDGKEELVSVKRNEGGFIHVDNTPFDEDEHKRCEFDCDILITNMRRVDADEERNLPEKAIIRGALFNDYNKTMLPMEFTVIRPDAIAYFESQDISSKNPLFTEIKGYQVNMSIERKVVEKGAFSDSVKTVKTNNKDWVVDWSATEPHLWDDESTLLASEVNEAMKNREIALATMKQRNDEWRASRASKPVVATPTTAGETFNF